jgi:hypothetical protein
MSTKQRWNDTDTERSEVLEQEPAPVPLAHQTFLTAWPATELGPPR